MSAGRLERAAARCRRLGPGEITVREVTSEESGIDLPGFVVERTRNGVVTDRIWVLPAIQPGRASDLIADARRMIESN